jgi:SAM-dependent methyltransferase
MLAPQGEAGFLAFSDLLTGYRQAAVLMLAHEAGIFAAVGREGCTGPELCAKAGWEQVYGERFLRCLCSLGLLQWEEERYTLTPFSQTYLAPQSPHYQGQTLLFERQLHQSWQQLAATLTAGQRVFATADKSPEELQQALALYLGAMDEAARIRAEELWNALPMAAPTGTILDLGAGSGAFLAAFLEQNPGWSGIFCDLPEVVASAGLHQRLAGVADRLSWCGCNLLADGPSEFDAIGECSCDLVLLSNLIHCQGSAETKRLLAKAAAKTAEGGAVVIHDFCTDTGWRGAVYDLHMMLNTYNGQAYTQGEIAALAASCGLVHRDGIQLPSGSTALVFARKQEGPLSIRLPEETGF